MGRFRLGAMSGVLGATALIGFGAANCAAPTQIIVTIQTDTPQCKTIGVGVAITSRADVDKSALSIYQDGCESGTNRVGTLTITPSGSKDAEVAIRIVGAVNGAAPDSCGLTDAKGVPQWKNCILSRRFIRFAPGQTVNHTVILSAQCIGQICDEGGERKECNLGKCVEEENIQTDGGNAPVKDGEPEYEDAHPIILDASPDAEPDPDPPDACALCTGNTGATAACNGVARACAVDCSDGKCKDKVLCGGDLDCTINCGTDESCQNTRCATTGRCSFNCTGAGGAQRCQGIRCAASTCAVQCEGTELTCNGVSMDGGTNTMSCTPTAAGTPTCTNVSCFGGTCIRTCGDGGCTGPSQCEGNCNAWQDGGDGG